MLDKLEHLTNGVVVRAPRVSQPTQTRTIPLLKDIIIIIISQCCVYDLSRQLDFATIFHQLDHLSLHPLFPQPRLRTVHAVCICN